MRGGGGGIDQEITDTGGEDTQQVLHRVAQIQMQTTDLIKETKKEKLKDWQKLRGKAGE